MNKVKIIRIKDHQRHIEIAYKHKDEGGGGIWSG